MSTVHRRRLRPVVPLVLALSCVLTACASKPDSGSDSITVFLIPSPSADAIKKLTPDFTAKTGINVAFVEAPYDDAHPKQLRAFSTKTGSYDVVQFDNPFLALYGEQKVLEALDGRLTQSTEYAIDDFVPALQDYGKYDGTTYGLDLSTEPFLVWYRSDLYKGLGLTAPSTWDQYLANARAVQASGKAAGQVMAYANPQTTWWWLQLLWSFGGDLYDSDRKPTVTTRQAVEATKFMKQLLSVSPRSALSANVDETTSVFISTDVGQMVNYSGFYPVVTDAKQSKVVGKVGYAKVPRGTADVTQLTGWNIGIPADSKRKDNAWKYLEYILGKSNAEKMLEAGAAAVGRTSITSNPALLAKYPYLKDLAEGARVGRRLPALPEWPEVQNAIGVRVSDVMTGKTTLEDGLRLLDQDLRSVLRRG